MLIYIYCLKDPITKDIRYIGKTIQKPSARYKSHISVSKHNSKKDYCHCWIKSLLLKGLLPIMEILEETEDVTRETYYILLYKNDKLTNFTNGGEMGNTGLTWKIDPSKIKPKIMKKVFVYDGYGNYKEFNSYKDCAIYFKIHVATLSNKIKNKILTRDGKIVSNIKLDDIDLTKYTKAKYSAIGLYKNDVQIKTFYSATCLAKYLNLDISTICKYIKTNTRFKEYTFKKIQELW